MKTSSEGLGVLALPYRKVVLLDKDDVWVRWRTMNFKEEAKEPRAVKR